MWDVEGANRFTDKINKIVRFSRHSTQDRILAFVALAASGVARWLEGFQADPDVRTFQRHLVARGMSWPALNQTVRALRFFYGVTLGRPDLAERITHAREPRKLAGGARRRGDRGALSLFGFGVRLDCGPHMQAVDPWTAGLGRASTERDQRANGFWTV